MESDIQVYKKVISRLKERAKELNCLYNVEEVLMSDFPSRDGLFTQLLEVIPPGWQHSTICEVRILYEDREYKTEDFIESDWMQSANIVIDDDVSGRIDVAYTQFIRETDGSQFLPEEQKLLNTIADRLSSFLFHQKLKKSVEFLKKENIRADNDRDLNGLLSVKSDEHWRWRMRMAENIAGLMDLERFDVHGIYVIGSTKNATAGPASDIDLLVHVEGDPCKVEILKAWLEGWSLCLSELNFIRTGYKIPDGLIDLHLITDKDIQHKTSFAAKITSTDDRARPLKIRKK